MRLTIAIVGRPNVGKSTLFNRLAQKKLAIVDDTPGVTRDWREAEGYLLDQPVLVMDTAGLEEAFDQSIEGRMRRQTDEALRRADAILFLIDGREGLTPMDEHFANYLRKQKNRSSWPSINARTTRPPSRPSPKRMRSALATLFRSRPRTATE